MSAGLSLTLDMLSLRRLDRSVSVLARVTGVDVGGLLVSLADEPLQGGFVRQL